ncbi:MAG: hypothetical protein V3V31_04605 [Methylococcales bacterium]
MNRNALPTVLFVVLSLVIIQALISIRGLHTLFTDSESVSTDNPTINGKKELSEDVSQHKAKTVRLTEKGIQMSGLIVRTLPATSYSPEMITSGTVAEIQPLIKHRAHYREASSQRTIAATALTSSWTNLERQKQLYDEGIVSMRKLQQAKNRWLTDKTQLAAAKFRIQDIRAETIYDWGKELYQWIATDPTGKFVRLVNGKNVLLHIVLPPGQTLSHEIRSIFVSTRQDRNKATKAFPISPAPMADPTTQSKTYFFRSGDSRLKPGMRLTAWIPQGDKSIAGFYLPESAVIWHQGIPWIYFQTQKQLFERREVDAFHDLGETWFIGNGVRSTDKIVTQGGQTLLSEEFHSQIGETDDD